MIDYTNYLNVDHLPITRYLKDNYQAIATEYSGILINDLERLGRVDSTVGAGVSNEHIQTMQIYVDPDTHAYTDILPDPLTRPGVIWVEGERIEYLKKTKISEHNKNCHKKWCILS
jgi:hypothetical protein